MSLEKETTGLTEEEKLKLNKIKRLSSRKFFCVVWAMLMGIGILALTGVAMFKEIEIPAWFGVAMPSIFGIVVTYITVNGWQKTTEIKSGGEK